MHAFVGRAVDGLLAATPMAVALVGGVIKSCHTVDVCASLASRFAYQHTKKGTESTSGLVEENTFVFF